MSTPAGTGSSRKQPIRFSIRNKMLVAFVGLTLAPMLLVGAVLSYRSETILRQRIHDELVSEVQTASEAVEVYVAGTRRDVLSLARFMGRTLQRAAHQDWTAVEDEFVRVLQTENAYYQVRFLSLEGDELLRVDNRGGRLVVVPANSLQSKAHRYYFQEAIRQEPGTVYVSQLDLNMEHGRIEEPHRLVTRVASPVTDSQGQVIGVVIINVFGEQLLGALTPLKTSSEIRVLLIGENQEVVEMVRDGGEEHFSTRLLRQVMDGGEEQILDEGGDENMRLWTTGRNLVATSPVKVSEERTWRLAKIYPFTVIEAAMAGHHQLLFSIALPLLLLATVLAVVAARRFSGPIRRLSKVAEAVARGGYGRRSKVETNDELGDLSLAINEMADSLADSRTKLLAWNRTLQDEVDLKVAELQRTEEEANLFRLEMQGLERQLVEADRLASLGMLSATIAHEIGNPLAGLKLRMQMMERRQDEAGNSCKDLPRLLPLVEKLERFLKQMTNYVRRPLTSNPAMVTNVAEALREVAFILGEEAARRDITFEISTPEQSLEVTSEGQQFHQILMNIVLNALQAVDDGGMVTVKASMRDDQLVVCVCDDGPGLPVDAAEKIFEPLFTTKVDGTGLGLPIVRRLLEDMGGAITIENRDGGGARAEITIPGRRKPWLEES